MQKLHFKAVDNELNSILKEFFFSFSSPLFKIEKGGKQDHILFSSTPEDFHTAYEEEIILVSETTNSVKAELRNLQVITARRYLFPHPFICTSCFSNEKVRYRKN